MVWKCLPKRERLGNIDFPMDLTEIKELNFWDPVAYITVKN